MGREYEKREDESQTFFRTYGGNHSNKRRPAMKTRLSNKGLFFIVRLSLLLFISAVTTAHAVNSVDYLPYALMDGKIEALSVGSITGTWRYTHLRHRNDGAWDSKSGKLTFNGDGTGTDVFRTNGSGTPSTKTKNFTYAAVNNTDGSITVNYVYQDNTAGTERYVMADDGNEMVMDGTEDASLQKMRIATRLDTSRTYSNADLNGVYYTTRYGYWKSSETYRAMSGLSECDGNGNMSNFTTRNKNGIVDEYAEPHTYSVSSDGSFTRDGGVIGGLMWEGIGAGSTHADTGDIFSLGISIKKQDRQYSTSDLAGKWVIASFGDESGTKFMAGFSMLTCDNNGYCIISIKDQRDGTIRYELSDATFSVASDGSFGASLAANSPSYAGAIGNNGNTIIINTSFDPIELSSRQIIIGVRCSNCTALDIFNYYCDDDGDGYISSRVSNGCLGNGCIPAECQATPGNDCSGMSPGINPGAKEGPVEDQTCNDGWDNDCDGQTDANDPDCSGQQCIPTEEICDGFDNDCDGQIDEGLTRPTVCGVGACASAGTETCTAGNWGGDSCTPGQPQTEGPYGDPTCTDQTDNDCDGLTDSGDIADCPDQCVVKNIYYRDVDGDGYGNKHKKIKECTQPEGYVADKTDCDDKDPNEYPGQVWYKDHDKDGYSDGTSKISCKRPKGYKIKSELTAISGDCADKKRNINPGMLEGPYGEATCNDRKDNNCDGAMDEQDSACMIL